MLMLRKYIATISNFAIYHVLSIIFCSKIIQHKKMRSFVKLEAKECKYCIDNLEFILVCFLLHHASCWLRGAMNCVSYKLYWPLLCSMLNSSLLNRLVMGRFYRFLAKELESNINMFKKMYFEAQLLISFLGEGSPDPVSQCWTHSKKEFPRRPLVQRP